MGANLLAGVVCLARRNPARHSAGGFNFVSSSAILSLMWVRAQGGQGQPLGLGKIIQPQFVEIFFRVSLISIDSN